MAINFPDSPSVNDTHTVGDKTWTWDGTAWNVVVGGIPTTIDTLTINQDAEVDGILTANHIHGNIAGSVYLHVKNTSGSSIPAGTPVYATGSVGASGATEVSPSDASTAGTMPAVGITQSTLAINAEGHATILGVIGSQDTSTYSLNQPLYVAPGGGLTATRPTAATDAVQSIARVVRVDASSGELLVMGAGRTNDVPNEISILGDLTVDTDTLHVDSTNDRVGIGTTSPTASLDVTGDYTSTGHVTAQSGGADGGIVLGQAFSSSYVGLRTAGMSETSIGEYVLISDGGDTYVSAGDTRPLYLRGGGNDSACQIKLDPTTDDIIATGRVTQPAQPFVQAKSGGGGWTTVGAGATWSTLGGSNFWGVNWVTSKNIGNCFNTSTAAFTAPVAGVYYMTWSAYYQSTTGGSNSYVHPTIFINGSYSWNNGQQPYIIYGYLADGLQNGLQHTWTFYLNSGDYVQPGAYFRSTNDQFHADYSYLSAGLLY